MPPAMTLRIKDQDYQHGLGHHANGQIVLDLAGQFQAFRAEVGVQWQGGQDFATVIFRVLADGKQVFDSGVMREGDAARPVDIPVAGVDELTLVVTDAGDGINCDCANWVDARLIPDPAAAHAPAVSSLDMAPFGCIATWDPQRMQGTAAGRVQEFPAADVRLHQEVLPQADGSYRVPTYGEAGCIGLQWDENRILRQAILTFTDAATIPPVETVQLQTWSGESAWQGSWATLDVIPPADRESSGLGLQAPTIRVRHAEDPLGVCTRGPQDAARLAESAGLLAFSLGNTRRAARIDTIHHGGPGKA